MKGLKEHIQASKSCPVPQPTYYYNSSMRLSGLSSLRPCLTHRLISELQNMTSHNAVISCRELEGLPGELSNRTFCGDENTLCVVLHGNHRALEMGLVKLETEFFILFTFHYFSLELSHMTSDYHFRQHSHRILKTIFHYSPTHYWIVLLGQGPHPFTSELASVVRHIFRKHIYTFLLPKSIFGSHTDTDW